MNTPIIHTHSAHCESGTLAALLANRGYAISEPMVFGISGSIFFAHFPFVRLYDIPLTSYRDFPRRIIRRNARRLGFKVRFLRYRNPDRAMEDLDRLLETEGTVGLQTSVFWLPYFPEKMRFHFNGHNIMVYGKENGDYLVSDPVLDKPVRCAAESLKRARFAPGVFAPRGALYYPLTLPGKRDPKKAVLGGLEHACRRMLFIPAPFFGYRGIAYLARRMRKWPERISNERTVRAYVGNVFRMQEEIGTGGAGFRFMYASFLQEAAALLERESLETFSRRMMQIGDRWRDFALMAGRFCKDKTDFETLGALSDILFELSVYERDFFRDLFRETRLLKKKVVS